MAKHTSPPTRVGRPVRWPEMTDGLWWSLRHGRDFLQEPAQAGRAARQWARNNNWVCNAYVVSETELKVRFTPRAKKRVKKATVAA